MPVPFFARKTQHTRARARALSRTEWPSDFFPENPANAARFHRQPGYSRPSNGELSVATMPVPEQLCSELPPPPPFAACQEFGARARTRARCSGISLRRPPRPAPSARRFGKRGEEGTTFWKLVMLPTISSCSDSPAGRGF